MTFDPVTPRLERRCRAAATPRFETGAAAYRWLNDLIAVGSKPLSPAFGELRRGHRERLPASQLAPDQLVEPLLVQA